MATSLIFQKLEKSKFRRVPFIPRVGVTVDWLGYQAAFRHSPILETLINLADKEFSVDNLKSVWRSELDDIRFPLMRGGLAAVKQLHTKVVEARKVSGSRKRDLSKK